MDGRQGSSSGFPGAAPLSSFNLPGGIPFQVMEPSNRSDGTWRTHRSMACGRDGTPNRPFPPGGYREDSVARRRSSWPASRHRHGNRGKQRSARPCRAGFPCGSLGNSAPLHRGGPPEKALTVPRPSRKGSRRQSQKPAGQSTGFEFVPENEGSAFYRPFIPAVRRKGRISSKPLSLGR